jgi:hypothetical protein
LKSGPGVSGPDEESLSGGKVKWLEPVGANGDLKMPAKFSW